jgi:hypothetical protein
VRRGAGRAVRLQQVPLLSRGACHTPPPRCALRQDPSARAALLEQAVQRLRHALQFSRGDAAPANALGDVLMDSADLLAGGLLSQGVGEGPPPGGVGVGAEAAAGVPPERLAAAAAAVSAAASEGYQGALAISRHNADALLGLGEAAVALGRLEAAAGEGGGGSAAGGAGRSAAVAAERFGQAAAYYGGRDRGGWAGPFKGGDGWLPAAFDRVTVLFRCRKDGRWPRGRAASLLLASHPLSSLPCCPATPPRRPGAAAAGAAGPPVGAA